MNYSVHSHNTASPCKEISHLYCALERLGAYLDAEHMTLGAVLAQSNRRGAGVALNELEQLHLDAGASAEDVQELLELAHGHLEYILEKVRDIPCRCGLQNAFGPPGPAPFDTHVRWSGARLEDIIATLEHALKL